MKENWGNLNFYKNVRDLCSGAVKHANIALIQLISRKTYTNVPPMNINVED